MLICDERLKNWRTVLQADDAGLADTKDKEKAERAPVGPHHVLRWFGEVATHVKTQVDKVGVVNSLAPCGLVSQLLFFASPPPPRCYAYERTRRCLVVRCGGIFSLFSRPTVVFVDGTVCAMQARARCISALVWPDFGGACGFERTGGPLLLTHVVSVCTRCVSIVVVCLVRSSFSASTGSGRGTPCFLGSLRQTGAELTILWLPIVARLALPATVSYANVSISLEPSTPR